MKTNEIQSVIHDWVSILPFTQQAVLMCSMRGPDGLNKNHPAKYITQFIRGAVMKPAYPNFNRDDDYHPNGFMRFDWQHFERDAQIFFDDVDQLPHHYYLHLIHACQIIGYSHPDDEIRLLFEHFYFYACQSFHMRPESKLELFERLKK